MKLSDETDMIYISFSLNKCFPYIFSDHESHLCMPSKEFPSENGPKRERPPSAQDLSASVQEAILSSHGCQWVLPPRVRLHLCSLRAGTQVDFLDGSGISLHQGKNPRLRHEVQSNGAMALYASVLQ